ncbi:hypothetical protein GCU56_20445 [Geodermatophilus sabuli]|uniref:Uncharacterized protein n=1 Tax=Geodermatophilus sabuli TaxID=1564158 RepID=A0A7K3W637_9ACTN|nr:hypothetical protein [Geodermatophilus sabuli]NEK60231.1 hypothetical protein [Geodermatophilus sabuli]
MSVVARWLDDRRVDFGVMDVAEGKRPGAVLGDKDLQRRADDRLRELERELECELAAAGSPK